ncbi:MAG: THUMP domain-containing protein [Candidatus Nanohaloarchaea archaeon]|nr:THUMP domain-containing protein [Candidatus Nanohaloarchaea archaeon]
MLLLVRYGEIGVKSTPVRRRFEDRLIERLDEVLAFHGLDGAVSREEGRIFVDVADDVAADAAVAAAQTPGVVSVSPVRRTGLDLDAIAATAVELLEDRDVPSFAIDARRAGDHDYTSEEVEETVGAAVQDELELAVDLEDPAATVRVEARYKYAYLSTTTVDGVGGLPVNRDARVAVLMTDRASTVAAFLLMKRGCSVYPVYTGEETDAVRKEIAVLRQYDPAVKLTVRGEDPARALDTVCDLYKCGAAAAPATAGELGDGLDLGREVLYPNAGLSEEEVLDRYAEIQAVPHPAPSKLL